ncbi:hypothetical protein [Mesorhizobium sp. B2-4-17]|nr:hypothetical protein [Mesorhizobium sp. B2-4-17]
MRLADYLDRFDRADSEPFPQERNKGALHSVVWSALAPFGNGIEHFG